MTARDDVLCDFEQPNAPDHEHKDAEPVPGISQAEGPSDQGNSGETLKAGRRPSVRSPLNWPQGEDGDRHDQQPSNALKDLSGDEEGSLSAPSSRSGSPSIASRMVMACSIKLFA